MAIKVKSFDELTAKELYEILRVRFEVFVMEQECVYLDPDGVDEYSLHVFEQNETGKVTAYLRLIPSENGTVKIGRVLTTERGTGNGKRLLEVAMQVAREQMGARHLTMEAQSHAIGFYEKLGFHAVGEEFLDAGIPHQNMEREF